MYTEGGAWGLIGSVDAYRPKGRGFDSHSNHHVGTLGKAFARSYLWRFGGVNSDTVSVLCWEHLWVVMDLKRCYRNSLD